MCEGRPEGGDAGGCAGWGARAAGGCVHDRRELPPLAQPHAVAQEEAAALAAAERRAVVPLAGVRHRLELEIYGRYTGDIREI